MKKKISKGTIIRTTLLALAITNNALQIAGKSPLPCTNEEVTEVITYAFTAATAIAAWWKNNSFTEAAIKADEVMKVEKTK